MEFTVGDRIYCPDKKMYGFITRNRILGCKIHKAVSVIWDNKKRDIINGHEACCKLVKQ